MKNTKDTKSSAPGPAGARLRRTALGQARKNPAIRKARQRLIEVRQRLSLGLAGLGGRLSGEEAVDPARLVWIFGSGRSGSTWLRSMMGELEGHRVWEEPMVGRLFGDFYERAQEANRGSKDFIMGEPVRRGWIHSIRNFVLEGARYSNPAIGPGDYLVVKEPNGSVGAPLIMEALPESRMILLVRDPRDVVASTLDGAKEGGWLHDHWDRGPAKKRRLANQTPNAFANRWANTYRKGLENSKKAYDTHRGPKVLVRYEDLVRDTPSAIGRIYKELGIDADEAALDRAVEKHAWENLPADEKGAGKFYRKGTPGGWKEDLKPGQARRVERTTAHLLDEFYPGWWEEAGRRARNVPDTP